ncbi:FecCD family ABC transporter permease [Oryzicola mucosus]|uniref:Iron ABC transporter permease n=1 Tax=Oryzicola mucosus TaxID=2767425 RepID=A0A8J6PSX9_9HYPH|nr:iron ABC transporter permease [Oryzicola mucosus]MBD0413183.1 iron ABC transporter permease [Oryzicola mucosus]
MTLIRNEWRLLVLGPTLLLIVLAAIFLGVVNMPPAEVLNVLLGYGSMDASLIIGDIRMPRVLTGVLAGIHFALAGLLLQTITRNPLADPSIMGVSQGATLAVTIFLFLTVYMFNNDPNILYRLPVQWLPLVGCVGGGAAGAGVYFLAFRHGLSPLRVTLCGIAVGAVLHAAAMGVISGWGTARLEIVMQWLSGSLYARSWDHVLFLVPFTLLGLVALPFMTRPIGLLRFEEDVARSFGLAYRRQFSLVLLLACGLAASAAGAVGPLIFVGLVVPHLARFIAGPRTSLIMPMTIILGAGLVTLGDLIGRLVGGPEEIPIGVVTAIGGAPVLLALLRRTVRG